MTLNDTVSRGSVICLIGRNRTYCIGDTAYKFRQQSPHGMIRGTPASWINGRWESTQGPATYLSAETEITILLAWGNHD